MMKKGKSILAWYLIIAGLALSHGWVDGTEAPLWLALDNWHIEHDWLCSLDLGKHVGTLGLATKL